MRFISLYLLIASCSTSGVIESDRQPAGSFFHWFTKGAPIPAGPDRKGDPFAKYYSVAIKKLWGRRARSSLGLCGPGKGCVKYVKDIYIELGCIRKDQRPGNFYAKDSVRTFQKVGFSVTKNKNPCRAKFGSLIVYDGPGAGHAEIRTPRGYLSDYLSIEPRTAGVKDEFIVSEAEFRLGKAFPRDSYCKEVTPAGMTKRKVKAILEPPPGCLNI